MYLLLLADPVGVDDRAAGGGGGGGVGGHRGLVHHPPVAAAPVSLPWLPHWPSSGPAAHRAGAALAAALHGQYRSLVAAFEPGGTLDVDETVGRTPGTTEGEGTTGSPLHRQHTHTHSDFPTSLLK